MIGMVKITPKTDRDADRHHALAQAGGEHFLVEGDDRDVARNTTIMIMVRIQPSARNTSFWYLGLAAIFVAISFFHISLLLR